ncbi:hypothetical protein DL769_005933 [Monosporascus sp. CRB-8-3]|nr:hypothetical protein DL769_005933 [Monosporascus sp. CRB-8-3]
MAVSNPIAFKPFAVTFWSTVAYLALLIPLVIIHESVPPPPTDPTPYPGINLTQSWLDLTVLTRNYHPFNSRENDEIHDWLLQRLEDIKEKNAANDSNVVVLEDMVSNVTVTDAVSPSDVGSGTYFEGTNIIVYIRGKDDPQGPWWKDGRIYADKVIGKGGVLMNAHYDSVSTGYGATDDGMGVVTLMALVDYFSRRERRPRRGIVALFNNNEEDWLWGARAFGKSPFMHFCHTFLNLEGAGAGGRATLFRATDAEVVHAYKGSEHPFGTVVSSDAWATGAIRSGTDYSIFHDIYGLRGLDVAFYRPRARYHTNQDDAKHTSKASLWHMLSSSLHTMERLSGNTGQTFIGDRPDGDRKKVYNGRPTAGVWFDMFGRAFAVFGLRTMFAWSLVLLIASPLVLIALTYILVRQDKYYFFSTRTPADEGTDLDPIMLGGRKGLVRFPLALVIAAALVVGSAYLVTKINPLVIYSNEYTVWAMMLSLFYFVFWTIMAGANFARPSALHRGYAIFWLFLIDWAILVVNTVFEDRYEIGAGYIFIFSQAAVFLASAIALCELFALPRKTSFARHGQDSNDGSNIPSSGPHVEDNRVAPGRTEADEGYGEEEEPEPPAATETTPLVGSSSGFNERQTMFGTTYRRSIAALTDNASLSNDGNRGPYEFEQPWSANLPSWVWIVQFLLLGPLMIVLIGQIGLTLVSSVSQTGADGSSLLLPYLLVAFFGILLLLPITPFMHRVTHHIPMFLLVVFIATLIYNLAAFPFSPESRYKVYFQQTVDLDTGSSRVSYVGLEEYVRLAVAQLPSAMGKNLNCTEDNRRHGLTDCSYDGSDILPTLIEAIPDGSALERRFTDWVTYNISRSQGDNKATFVIDAEETRSCAITFEKPISSFKVHGGSEPDERFGAAPKRGFEKLTLYRRDWDSPWKVDVKWEVSPGEESEIKGQITCGWDDVNRPGTVPAYEEGIKFTPAWVALSKLAPGLLKGSKAFKA